MGRISFSRDLARVRYRSRGVKFNAERVRFSSNFCKGKISIHLGMNSDKSCFVICFYPTCLNEFHTSVVYYVTVGRTIFLLHKFLTVGRCSSRICCWWTTFTNYGIFVTIHVRLRNNFGHFFFCDRLSWVLVGKLCAD